MVKRKLLSSTAAFAVCTLLTLLLIFEEDATVAAKDALSLAVGCIIPSLFPYMVISSVIISLDLLEPFYSLIPMEKLFHLPRSGASVLLCGLLCGFPIGASGTTGLCQAGKLSTSDGSVLCAISSHTSPAFLIGAVGVWWNCREFGILLYLAEIAFALLSALGLKCRNRGNAIKTYKSAPPAKSPVSTAVCTAISDGAIASLAIVGYIVFFRVVSSILSALIPKAAPVFTVIFEFSAGAMYGARIGGIAGAAVTGFAVGFSGIAVFMQMCNFTSRQGIPMLPAFIIKLTEGVFLGAVSAVYAAFFPMIPSVNTLSLSSAVSLGKIALVLSSLLVLFFASSYCRKRNYFQHRS